MSFSVKELFFFFTPTQLVIHGVKTSWDDDDFFVLFEQEVDRIPFVPQSLFDIFSRRGFYSKSSEESQQKVAEFPFYFLLEQL